MTAIDQPHFKLKLQDVARKLYIEHRWTMPDGLIDSVYRNPLNFDRQEWFQAKRRGQDPRAIKRLFQQCWAASDSGKAFRQALQSRGFYVARGDRRAVVAVDLHGEIYAVARWTGVKTKVVVNRLGDLDTLPSIGETKARIAGEVQAKLTGFIESATAEFAKAAKTLEGKRQEMVERHRAARREMQALQEKRRVAEAKARADRLRSGIRGLWDRITGQHGKICRQNEAEAAAAKERDATEKEILLQRQLEERRHLQREIVQARRSHQYEVAALHSGDNSRCKFARELGG